MFDVELPMIVMPVERSAVSAQRFDELRLEHHHGRAGRTGPTKICIACRWIDAQYLTYAGSDASDLGGMVGVGSFAVQCKGAGAIRGLSK